MTTTPTNDRRWTLLTNHGHVLVALSRSPDARIRDLAATVGITERATQNILADLEAAGYVTRQREGRRNRYQLHPDRRFRHPAEAEHEVGELLALFTVEAEVPRIPRGGGGWVGPGGG